MRVMVGLLTLGVLTTLFSSCAGGGERPQSSAPEVQITASLATPRATYDAPSATATAIPPTATATATEPAPLAAVVNGQVVYLDEFEGRFAQYELALQARGLDTESAEGQAYMAQARHDALEGLIDGVIIEQGATAMGVGVGDQEIAAQVSADISGGGGEAAFHEWLEATGQTESGYRVAVRQSMLAQRVLEAVGSRLAQGLEQVRVRQIAVESEEEAQEIVHLIQEGAEFSALARERSLDLATKADGGDIGWFPRGVVALELEEAAFALQPGEVAILGLSGGGYYVIQVVEREMTRRLAPEARVALELGAFDAWLAEERARAVIERFVRE